MKKYKCIKEMQFEIMDEHCDGTGEYSKVKIGDTYIHTGEDDFRSSCEIYLEKDCEYGWLECYEEDLKEYFEEIN